MKRGDNMMCDMISGGQRTGQQTAVRVLEIRHRGLPPVPVSVRVRVLPSKKGSQDRVAWVDPHYLHVIAEDNGSQP